MANTLVAARHFYPQDPSASDRWDMPSFFPGILPHYVQPGLAQPEKVLFG
jgi:hypothetical protein